ncbi:MAG: class I SAM-dependent methyltransferase [Patescibacteria group bacterium]
MLEQLVNLFRSLRPKSLYWRGAMGFSAIYESLTDVGLISPRHQQSLIKRKISRILINDYNGDEGHNINTTQYFLGFGLIHYALVRNIQPKNVLCVGSRMGFIPAILALACQDNGRGHVDFVDAGYDRDQPKKHWSGIGFWKKNDPAEHFARLGLKSWLTTFVMTTAEFAQKYPNRRYQYIYVDGDHSYRGVKLDYRLFWPQLDPGGFMAFHDIVARGFLDQGKFGVWKFWQELKHSAKISFNFPKDSGLGILQKQDLKAD